MRIFGKIFQASFQLQKSLSPNKKNIHPWSSLESVYNFLSWLDIMNMAETPGVYYGCWLAGVIPTITSPICLS